MIDVSRFAGKGSDYTRFAKLSSNATSTEKHLAGKHDQSSHGRGGGVSAPRDTVHAKQKQAWELHEQGKTWEEVAQLAGYANGGAARKAGLQHKKRLDEGGGGDKPKPDDTPTPERITPKEGAEAIAQAKAIVDKATGGRPVADVLAEERAKTTSMAPATDKEKEVTEAVIQAGQILRAEVDRRCEIAGGERLTKARKRVAELETQKKEAQDALDVARTARDKAGRDAYHAMTQSNAFKDEIDATIDEGLTHYRDDSPLKRMSLGKDRALMVEDLRMAVELDSAYSGKRVDFREHEKWAKDRAKLRFPDDENAQKSYARMLEGNWIEHRANKKLRNHPKTAHLYEAKDKAEQVFSEAQSRHWDVDKELRAEHRLVQTKGVTPEQNADIVKEVLRDAGRTMTDKPSQSIKGTKKNVAELRDEMTKIPDELWVPTKYTGLSVRAVASGRGHWSSGRQEIKTDGSGSRKASTLLHEATHAVENMNPQVTQLEFVMFERRAKGRQPEKLQKLYKGMGYKKHEEAVVDEWSSAYSGKRYGTSRSSTHEIMTMGIESLFRRGDYPSPLADDDHLNFVMGVLAHA